MAATLKLRDDRIAPRSSSVRFRPAWGFKGPAKDLIRNWLEDCERPHVHLCAGGSSIGDVKVDLYHPSADVRADAFALPFGDVPTLICDPPFGTAGPGWDVKDRLQVVAQVVRAMKPGGKVIWHAPWFPNANLFTLEECRVRELGHISKPLPPILISRWRRER